MPVLADSIGYLRGLILVDHLVYYFPWLGSCQLIIWGILWYR
jgi:hypothetical protein